MAAHSRGLQDAGLAKYAGSAPLIVAIVASIVAIVIGYLLEKKYCEEGQEHVNPSFACFLAKLLLIWGIAGILLLLAGLVFGLLGLTGAGPSDSGCASGVWCYSPVDGSSGCCEKSIPPTPFP
jgi:hypothetical protein